MDVSEKLLEMSKAQSTHFSEDLAKWEKIADHVFQMLEFGSSVKVSRVKIGGSVGKRICAQVQSETKRSNQPDLELIAFVSKEWPPFHNVLERFAFALNRFKDPVFEYAFVRIMDHCVHFRVKDIYPNQNIIQNDSSDLRGHTSTSTSNNSISVCIHVAMNLLSPNEELKLPAVEKEAIQIERSLRHISKLPNMDRRSRFYTNNTAEGVMSFVASQSSFVQHVIRLGKLWNNQVVWEDSSEKLYKRSTIIELVAVWAGTKEEGDARQTEREANILTAFRIFLIQFIDFDRKMFVFFPFQEYTNINVFYETHSKKTTTVQEQALILDPVNPFLNYAPKFTSEMRRAFQVHAESTLDGLNKCSGFQKYSAAGLECNIERYFGL